MEKDEQMYVNLTYDIQKGGRNRLFHEDYVGLVDSVVVDGKTLSACNETDLASGEHKVCLNFKKGIELTTLKNFFGDTALKSIDDNNLDVSKVWCMFMMFSDCKSLQNVDGLKDWNVSNVNDMSAMFAGCHSLQNVDGLKDWDVSTVMYMNDMFSGCHSLQNVVSLQDIFDWKDLKHRRELKELKKELKRFETDSLLELFESGFLSRYSPSIELKFGIPEVGIRLFSNEAIMDRVLFMTRNGEPVIPANVHDDFENLKNQFVVYLDRDVKLDDMSRLFEDDRILEGVRFNNFDTSQVVSMASMFFGCRNLSKIDGLENWDVSNVKDMSGMFAGVGAESFSFLKNWDTSSVENMSAMFAGVRLNLSDIIGWNLSSVNAKENIFNRAVFDFDEKEVIAQAKNPGNIIEQLKGEIGGKIVAIYDEAKAKEDRRAKVREFYSQMTAAEIRNRKNGKNL